MNRKGGLAGAVGPKQRLVLRRGSTPPAGRAASAQLPKAVASAGGEHAKFGAGAAIRGSCKQHNSLHLSKTSGLATKGQNLNCPNLARE